MALHDPVHEGEGARVLGGHTRAGQDDAGQVQRVRGRQLHDDSVDGVPGDGPQLLGGLGKGELLAGEAGDIARPEHHAARLEPAQRPEDVPPARSRATRAPTGRGRPRPSGRAAGRRPPRRARRGPAPHQPRRRPARPP